MIAALYDAFDTGNDLHTEGMLDHAHARSCRWRSRCASSIEAMREWARTRARSASHTMPRRVAQSPSKSWLARHGADIDKDTDKASEPAGDGAGNGSGERKLEDSECRTSPNAS